MRLPNPERASIGRKLEDYVLNPHHREGRHKARVFESILGITLANQAVLREAILQAAAPLVLTAWIVRHGEDFPRLTTCYIL